MGQARRRGPFEVRKAQAITAGRDPEVRRRKQREVRQARATKRREYQDYVRRTLEHVRAQQLEVKVERIRAARQVRRAVEDAYYGAS